MENFPNINSENQEALNKEKLGIKFKNILHEKAEYYDKNLSSLNKMVAGEDFDRASRSSFILKSAIKDFINTPGFPESHKEKIWQNLAMVESLHPMTERQKYYDAKSIDEKNRYVDAHNQKFGLYKGWVKTLLESLRPVLPESMSTELLFRNDMFASLLNWVDENNQNVI